MITVVNGEKIMAASIAATFMDGDSEMMLVKVANTMDTSAPAPKATLKAPTFKAKKPKRLVAPEIIKAAEEAPAVVPVRKGHGKGGPKAKPVVCQNTEMVFASAREAAKTLFPEGDEIKDGQRIRLCCNGKQKDVNGFTFAYAEASN